jgi:hypothetical protein
MQLKRVKHFVLSGAVLLLASPLMHADAGAIDLNNFAVTDSTGNVADWLNIATPDPTALPGMSITPTSGAFCCNDATGGTTPGLGTVSYTFNPGAAGTYQVNLYFDHDLTLNGPVYNEFGTVNNAGAIQAGMSYEIYDADNPSGDIALYSANPGSPVYGNPNNTNEVPGTTSNFLDNCSAAGCNADVGLALGYNFTLSAGQEAVITATTSQTSPATGFFLDQTHPVDLANPTQTDLYLTGGFSIQPIPNPGSGTPEPSTWLLMGSAIALLAGRGRLRKLVKA